MTKHVIDGPEHTASKQVAERFARIESDKLPRPQTLTMQKRPRSATEGVRLKQYMAIDRRKASQ